MLTLFEQGLFQSFKENLDRWADEFAPGRRQALLARNPPPGARFVLADASMTQDMYALYSIVFNAPNHALDMMPFASRPRSALL
jgi:hypothetical protein